ncbi:hypothetical protein OG901_16570 [Streptomyces mirabilis]|jgi:hypothetical protein|uniref:hypothetical protein n=2 Tax=Streptomyces mirabilis TaxID=68239 RepID=UPI00225ADCE5|nr:hypothetical protein [Streptomyces mirabilis]MCX5349366.1 hypothetical protein [Streptomyces mirabilis]
MPDRMGWRGAGLGNEIFPWAKAYLASRELGFRCLRPAWGLNRRGYWRDFGTSRLDWVGHTALRAVMPVVKVTDEMVSATGEVDYGAAVRVLDGEYKWSRRRSILLLHESMSGGYLGIERARNYLRNVLLGSLPQEDCAASRDACAGQLRVAVHIRLGDFQADPAGPRPGVFNTRIPLQWYHGVLDILQRHFEGRLHIDIVSDEPEQLARAFPRWKLCSARSRSMSEDLSIMTAADLLVCSVSSFSMLAAFLSDVPYLWYRPQMFEQDGFVSIWGDAPEQQAGPTGANIRKERENAGVPPARGVPVDLDAELPSWLVAFLETKVALSRHSADLMRYGVVSSGAPVRALG